MGSACAGASDGANIFPWDVIIPFGIFWVYWMSFARWKCRFGIHPQTLRSESYRCPLLLCLIKFCNTFKFFLEELCDIQFPLLD